MPVRTFAIALSLVALMIGCRSMDTSAPVTTSNSSAVMTPVPSPSTAAPAAAATVKSKIDPCTLLTNDEVKAVQGEAPTQAQRSDRRQSGFIVSQCYYSLPTTSNSVVLNITTAEDDTVHDTREFWKKTFASKNEPDKDRDRKAKETKGEEEEEAVAPEKISGLGEDAYWIASRVGGALYVLKKNLFFRISVGGAGDAKTKLNKSKTLARKALARI